MGLFPSGLFEVSGKKRGIVIKIKTIIITASYFMIIKILGYYFNIIPLW